MNKRFTTVLFDADNTLLNFDKDEDEALRRVLTLYGVPITKENIETYVKINQGMWKALERGELTKPELKRTRFRKFFDAIGFVTDIDPFEINEKYLSFLSDGGNTLDGAVDICRELKEKGYDLYIITNGIHNTQKSRLTKAGLIDLFSDIFVSETLGHQKPKKEYFDIVLGKIKEKNKEKVLIVGDSLTSDIRGAMNAEISCVWLNMKGSPLPDEYSPDYIISDIREVTDILP